MDTGVEAPGNGVRMRYGRTRGHRTGWRRTGAAVASALVVILALVGCSASNESASDESASGIAAEPRSPGVVPDQGVGERTPSGETSDGGQSQDSGHEGKTSPKPGPVRHVIHTADLSLEVKDLAAARDRVRDLAESSGGYLADESSTGSRARLELKLPAQRFGQHLDRLGELGTVRQRSQEARDVTDQMVDTESRIASQKASVQRLRALLAEATDIGEIVEIEGELTQRESELDSVRRQHAALSDQVALATVTVTLTPRSSAPEEEPDGFLAGLVGGWYVLTAVGVVTLRVLGGVLPFLAVIGVPVGVLWLLWRRRAKVIKS